VIGNSNLSGKSAAIPESFILKNDQFKINRREIQTDLAVIFVFVPMVICSAGSCLSNDEPVSTRSSTCSCSNTSDMVNILTIID
jgi:hypothetical protein